MLADKCKVRTIFTKDSANIRRSCDPITISQTLVLLMLVGRCKDCANVVQKGEKMQRRPNYLCKRTQDSDEEKMHPNCGNIPTGQSQEMWFLENLTTNIFAFKTNLVQMLFKKRREDPIISANVQDSNEYKNSKWIKIVNKYNSPKTRCLVLRRNKF